MHSQWKGQRKDKEQVSVCPGHSTALVRQCPLPISNKTKEKVNIFLSFPQTDFIIGLLSLCKYPELK
jgi:hypothetical protein